MSQISKNTSLFNPANDILALDCDGVIVDSIAECLVVGYNAFNSAIGCSERINDLSQLPSEIQQESRRLRNFIRHGEDYVYIFKAIADNFPIHNQADFDDYLEKNRDVKEEFRTQFYLERARFLREEPLRWLALNPFYDGMADFLRNFSPPERLYIITTKKLEYVQVILNTAGIPFQLRNLFAANSQKGKPEIIADLLQKIGLSPGNFYFVDDQVDTLIKLKPLKIRLFVAGWGYTSPEQIHQAEIEGIPTLTLNEFYQLFSVQD
ncbi:MAG TPA: hypothetical protein PLO79_06360 [Candidatus Marinimicrobia bacterium]|nr:hypothetical protein [Candidatus Neomarinimicrobiota bacterium]